MSSLRPTSSLMTWRAGEDRDVLQHGLAAVTEAGGLDGGGLEGAADLVDDQGREGLALDVLGDDRQRTTGLHDLLQQRQQVLDRADLGVDDQHVRVVEHGLHALGVGHEVRADVALVEAHALGELELQAEGVALLDGDDAFLADLVHRLGDDAADGRVGRRDAGGGGDLLLGLDVLGSLADGLDDGLDGGLDALLQTHRVGAGGDVAQTLAHERLGQHGGGGGAVTRDVVGLLGDLLDQLGADLLVGVLELDLLGDGDAVVGDGGGAPLLLQDHVSALRAEGDLDGVGELVHAALETAAGLFVECDQFGHVAVPPDGDCAPFVKVPATDDRLTGLTWTNWHSARVSATCLVSTLTLRVQGPKIVPGPRCRTGDA